MKLAHLALAVLLAASTAHAASHVTVVNANDVSLEVTADGRGHHYYLGRVPAHATRNFHLKHGSYTLTATTRWGDEISQAIRVNRHSTPTARFERAPGDQVNGRYDHSDSWYRKWGGHQERNWGFATGR